MFISASISSSLQVLGSFILAKYLFDLARKRFSISGSSKNRMNIDIIRAILPRANSLNSRFEDWRGFPYDIEQQAVRRALLEPVSQRPHAGHSPSCGTLYIVFILDIMTAPVIPPPAPPGIFLIPQLLGRVIPPDQSIHLILFVVNDICHGAVASTNSRTVTRATFVFQHTGLGSAQARASARMILI